MLHASISRARRESRLHRETSSARLSRRLAGSVPSGGEQNPPGQVGSPHGDSAGASQQSRVGLKARPTALGAGHLRHLVNNASGSWTTWRRCPHRTRRQMDIHFCVTPHRKRAFRPTVSRPPRGRSAGARSAGAEPAPFAGVRGPLARPRQRGEWTNGAVSPRASSRRQTGRGSAWCRTGAAPRHAG